MKKPLLKFSLLLISLFISTSSMAAKKPLLCLNVGNLKITEAPKNTPPLPCLKAKPKDWHQELERAHEKIWVDLYPTEAFQFEASEHDLKEALDAYHKLTKTKPTLAPLRRKMLTKIEELCQAHLKNTLKNQTQQGDTSHAKLDFILKIARNKSDYLAGILEIKDRTTQIAFRMQKPGVPLRSMDPSLFERELLEHLDPAVRGREILQSYFRKWEHLASQPDASQPEKIPDFFFWLETQNLPLENNIKSEDEENASTATRIVDFDHDGYAHSTFFMTRPKGTYSKELLETASQEYADPIYYGNLRDHLQPEQETEAIHYAMNENGALFIRLHSPYHSYVLRGQNVISAGYIRFKGGKIERLDNESGHYTPPDSNLDFAKKLLHDKYGESIFSSDFSLRYREKSKGRDPKNLPQPSPTTLPTTLGTKAI